MKHEPKPEIEFHPHIQALIERQEKRTKDRNQYRNREKENEEREEEIAKAKPFDIIEFWCSECREDFAHFAHKQVEKDWTNPTQRIAFYKGVHDCGTWSMRHITDRLADPYWLESIQVAQDRGKHFADLIQPFESGYQLLYGRKNT